MKTSTPSKFDIEACQILTRLHHPGFAVLSGVVNWHESNDIETACTDGRFVKFNPGFMSGWSRPQQMFIVLHELLHVARKHMVLRQDRDPGLWNVACDHYINLLLKANYRESQVAMPKNPDGSDFGYADPKFSDMSEFAIYDALVEEQEQGGDPSQGGEGLGDVEDLGAGDGQDGESGDGAGESGDGAGDGQEGEPGDGDDKSMTQKEVDALVRKINQAVQTAECVGKMSGEGGGLWEDLAGALRSEQVRWEKVLRRFMTNTFPAFRAWSQLDRRMLACGIAYPGVIKRGTSELVFAVDCSGSMSRETVLAALAECRSAMEQCDIEKLHILYFTGQVEGVDTFTRNQTPEIRESLPTGGTCIKTAFECIAREYPNAKGIVCMTDGDFGHWSGDHRPAVPVLWGLEERYATMYQPPYGDTFKIPEGA